MTWLRRLATVQNEHRERELTRMRARNNPAGEHTGHHTGRCMKCGSDDLWDDNLAYGCNSCGAIYT